MWHSRPPRDPPPLHGKCHLKFPFWFSAHLPNRQRESVFIECSPRLQVVQYGRSCHCERSSLGSPRGHQEEEPNHLGSWGHPEPGNEIQECVDLMLIKLQTCFNLLLNVLTFITYLLFIISFTPLLQQLSSLGLTRLTWVVWFGFLYSYKWSQINQVSKLGWNGFRIPWAKVYWVSQSVTSSFLERLLIPNTVDI